MIVVRTSCPIRKYSLIPETLEPPYTTFSCCRTRVDSSQGAAVKGLERNKPELSHLLQFGTPPARQNRRRHRNLVMGTNSHAVHALSHDPRILSGSTGSDSRTEVTDRGARIVRVTAVNWSCHEGTSRSILAGSCLREPGVPRRARLERANRSCNAGRLATWSEYRAQGHAARCKPSSQQQAGTWGREQPGRTATRKSSVRCFIRRMERALVAMGAVHPC
jgi:hypothetical protein